MTVEKMSVSLPAKLARVARREAKREGMTVSAWVAKAVERETKLAAARRLMDEWEAEHGPVPEEEMEWVRREWG